MTVNFDEVKQALYRLRNEVGHGAAVSLIHKYAADRLADVKPEFYDQLHSEALALLSKLNPLGGLSRASTELVRRTKALLAVREILMAAIDDLTAAVNNAVSEMGKAADFIKAHPPAQNDPQLQDLATRLQNAATALSGVDVEQVATSGSTGSTTSGTDTVTGASSTSGTDTVTGASTDTVTGGGSTSGGV